MNIKLSVYHNEYAEVPDRDTFRLLCDVVQTSPESQGPNLIRIIFEAGAIKITRHSGVRSPLPLSGDGRLLKQDYLLKNKLKYFKGTFEYEIDASSSASFIQLRHTDDGITVFMTNKLVGLFPIITITKIGGLLLHQTPDRFLKLGFPLIRQEM